MSLLIKALDKAQAEKAQAKISADKKQTDKPKKRAKSQARQAKTIVETSDKKPNDAALSLSPPPRKFNSKCQAG